MPCPQPHRLPQMPCPGHASRQQLQLQQASEGPSACRREVLSGATRCRGPDEDHLAASPIRRRSSSSECSPRWGAVRCPASDVFDAGREELPAPRSSPPRLRRDDLRLRCRLVLELDVDDELVDLFLEPFFLFFFIFSVGRRAAYLSLANRSCVPGDIGSASAASTNVTRDPSRFNGVGAGSEPPALFPAPPITHRSLVSPTCSAVSCRRSAIAAALPRGGPSPPGSPGDPFFELGEKKNPNRRNHDCPSSRRAQRSQQGASSTDRRARVVRARPQVGQRGCNAWGVDSFQVHRLTRMDQTTAPYGSGAGRRAVS